MTSRCSQDAVATAKDAIAELWASPPDVEILEVHHLPRGGVLLVEPESRSVRAMMSAQSWRYFSGRC